MFSLQLEAVRKSWYERNTAHAEKEKLGTFLVIQWLRLHSQNAGARILFLRYGLFLSCHFILP